MARLWPPTRSTWIPAVLAAIYAVGREVLSELVFGSSGEWLEKNTWLLGNFLAWQPYSTVIVSMGLVIVTAGIIMRFSKKEETVPTEKRPGKSGAGKGGISGRTNIIGSVGQRGGKTTQNINIGTQRRTLKNVDTTPFTSRAPVFADAEVTFTTVQGDPEGLAFAMELKALLESVGVTVRDVTQGAGAGWNPRGVIVQCPPSEQGAAQAIADGIAMMGFQTTGERLADGQPFRIIIGFQQQ